MTASRELPLRDDLRYRERQQHGETEASERQRSDVEREGMNNCCVGH
jgi:hypothetical protein